jgi:RNA polymerase sigma-70 factor, ECF subfamily
VNAAKPLTECTDEELLIRFKRGQRDAFGAMVRRYERELYGYLRRYLGDGDLADDVFQNTFLQLYTKISTYESGRRVRPWLYTIAKNQAIDALRRSGRHPTVSLDQASDSIDGDVQSLISLVENRSSGPADAAVGEERRQLIRASVDRLPDFLRQVVILAYYQGLKYREIADIMRIPVGTVKSRLHAALTKLNEAWSAQPALHEK